MATHALAPTHAGSPAWGRLTLQADALSCVACGLVVAADSAPLADFTGLPRAVLLPLAPALVGYRAGLFLATRSPRRVPRLLAVVPALNAAWVVASVAALVVAGGALTMAGRWTVGLLAAIVADFAVAQVAARRRAR